MAKYMQLSHRRTIESMAGSKRDEVAKAIGFSVAAIYKETKKNKKPYSAAAADELAKTMRVNKALVGEETKRRRRAESGLKNGSKCNCRGTGSITFYSDHRPMTVKCLQC